MKKALLFLISMIILPNIIFAMSVKTLIDEMNARYDRIMKKSGGIKITQKIENITDGAKMTSEQIILKKGHKYRIETVSQMDLKEEKTKNIILFDGKNVWLISPFVGISMMPKDEAMIQGVFDSFSKLIPLDSKITGKEEVNNDNCYIIETPENETVPFNKIWVSETRFVPLKATGRYDKKIVTLIFTEYKKIGGEWGIPYKTEIVVNGKASSTTTVKSVQTGVKIPDKTFDASSQ